MDIVEPAKRSLMMSGIRGKNTKPEMVVRRFLHAQGYRYRLHRKDLPGKPDIVLPKLKTCVFVHGCFWHRHLGCRYAALPKTRAAFWEARLNANVDRDQASIRALQKAGWNVFVIWECELRRPNAVLQTLSESLRKLPVQV